MFNKVFTKISKICFKYKKRLFVTLIFLIVLAISSMFTLKLDNSMDAMIPQKGDALKSVNFLREADMAGKLALSISLKTPSSRVDLIKVSDELKAKLNGGPITEVLNGIDDINIDKMFKDIRAFVPQTIGAEELESIEGSLDYDALAKRVSGIYKRLLMPGPSQANMLFSDPLAIYSNYFLRIQTLLASFAYKIELVDGHFLSADNLNALLVLSTDGAVTDSIASKELLAHIDNVLVEYRDRLDYILVSGHKHTVSNEEVIKADVKRISIVALLAFLVLFGLIFKDPRAILVFILPFVAILLSISINSLWMGRMSYLIIGFAVVMAGIAIDYAIHIYYALLKTNKREMADMAKPVIVGALTTMGVFVAFFFSSVSGYKQLALFSIFSLFISLLLAIFVLPLFISKTNNSEQGQEKRIYKPRFCSLKVGVWAALIYIAWMFSGTISIGSDIRSFDGSQAKVWQAEESFAKVWAHKDQPLLLVLEGDNLDLLMQEQETVFKLFESKDAQGLVALAKLWPSKQKREANLARWTSFWSKERNVELANNLKKASQKYGFKKDVFTAFISDLELAQFSSTDLPHDVPLLELLIERFYSKKNELHRLIIYLDDTVDNHGMASEIADSKENIFLVSREEIARNLSELVFDEIFKLSRWALGFIIIIAFVLLRNVRKTLLAMLPVLTAVMFMGAVLGITGIGITAITVVAALIVLGLAVDYGIFVVYHELSPLAAISNKAVTLSFITTVIGAGSLLWAKHPVMYSIGITLVSGVFAAYLSSIIVIPALSYMTQRSKLTLTS